MGCMQDKSFDLEFNLSKEMPSKNQIFAFDPDKDDIKNPATLSENALLNDDTVTVQVITEKNDIEPVGREELLKISNRISKHAVAKIPKIEDNPTADKFKVDPKVVKHLIKST